MLFPGADDAERARVAINGDAEFALAARHLSSDMLLREGDGVYLVRLRDGVVSQIVLDATTADSWDFSIEGPAESWEKLLQPVPPPFFNGVYSGMMRGKFRITGNIESAYAHLRAVNRMMDLLRERRSRQGPTGPERRGSGPTGELEPVTGK